MDGSTRACAPFSVRPTWFLALLLIASSVIAASAAIAKERRVEVNWSVDLKAPPEAKHVRLWIPYPMSDENQEITDVVVNGNPTSWGVYKEGAFGNAALYAEWKDTKGPRTLTYSFKVLRKERLTKDTPTSELPFSKTEFRKELAATRLADLKGPEKELAEKITAGKKTNREKASAIYNWTVETMFRDPATKGCGIGDVDTLVRTLGGKCGDIHSVYTALARVSGVPTREMWGNPDPFRQGRGHDQGTTLLGGVVLTRVRLGRGRPRRRPEGDPGKEDHPRTGQTAQGIYFGGVDKSRIAIGTGRDLVLNPPQSGEPLNYFMYPYAEADGKPLNEDLFGFNLGYEITFREI